MDDAPGTRSVELTPDERHALLALLDVAVKAGGLSLAAAAAALASKFADSPAE